jgi:energy-coupling factor transporter ATP-binding protein EcfA2
MQTAQRIACWHFIMSWLAMRSTQAGPDLTTPYATEIPVLGIVTRFVSNSEHVLAVVEDAFGSWRSLDASLIEQQQNLTVRMTVRTEPYDAGVTDDHVAHVPQGDDRLLVIARDAFGISDPQRGEASAWVTADMLREQSRFRFEVLEALTWALLTRCDRQPLHAAALVRDGAGLLLCGPSGAGKSTLAYAAARAGIRTMSEDTVFVQMRPVLRVWSMPGAFRLLPEAAARFDELAGVVPTRLHNGKQKVVVDARAVGAVTERVVDSCGVCVIGERRGSAECRPLSGAQVLAAIDFHSDAGFDAFATTIAPAVERLAERGAWLLHPSLSPDASVPLLDGMLDSVAAGRERVVRHVMHSFSQPRGVS